MLARLTELGLLEISEDDGFMKHYDEPVRRTIASQLMGSVDKPSISAEMITIPFHTNFVIEGISSGFLLPYSQSNEFLIGSIFQLLQNWLVSPGLRPKGMLKDEQFFIRKLVLVFSMLFDSRKEYGKSDREESDTELELRCRLCRSALKDVYHYSAKNNGHNFSRETWNCYLKVLLAVTDQIMNGPSYILKKLATIALKVLFEVWILAKTTDEKLWKSLSQILNSHEWVSKTSSTIFQWNAVCLGITKYSLALVYKKECLNINNFSVIFALEANFKTKEDATFELSPEQTFFYWWRFLHLIRNPVAVTLPQTLHLACTGIANLVNCYLEIAATPLRSFTSLNQ